MARLWILGALGLSVALGACVDGTGGLGPGLGQPDLGPLDDGGLDGGWIDGGWSDAGPRDVGSPRDTGPEPVDAGPPLECTPGEMRTCRCGDRPGTQVCRSDGTLSCCVCENLSEAESLACLEIGMQGTWEGTITTPWREPYEVRVTFREDGSYGAWCQPADPSCTVFYYGQDGDRQGRRYRMVDIGAGGAGTGDLTVVWRPNDGQTGDLRSVLVTRGNERLRFDFWRTWAGRYGPIEADLRRVPR